ncbi:MAG: dihydrodipicolinate synthase family protein [Bacteroidetes bacterium GWF2_49_14]|nr:MAG: dihydrodipicolinate synthase family protein [Bacteroidetes bacterium GWF2_49_14]HBB90146.1 dihydrodipicolinate synthase family protein [Bacteroidales bacterium]
MNWNGVFPAVTTKFNPDFSLDIKGFQLNLEAQIKAGVNGLVLGGTLGEASVLADDEKERLIRAAKEVAGNRIPVLLNIAAQATSLAISQIKKAEQIGVDGFMLLPPMRYAPDEREAVEFLMQAAGSTHLPVMIYNNPVDYKTLVTLEMFEELSKLPNILAVKESTRDVTNVTRMINRFGDRFAILCGVDTIALESMVMGAVGWVAGLVCAFPAETVAIHKLAAAGKITEARELFRWFLPLLELDIHPKLVQYIKLAESKTGLGTETCRPPRLPLTGEERIRIETIINTAIQKRPALG